ncbi:hypothetical protein DK254_00755 [Pseudomonas sp. RW407]|uniref:hypothetical protein n=1 Tax=Pseudomonas sp. RW407 TaxID=2202894 RepID=UPI000D700AF3|nr:hypothetical protein [Pseudomonas sp. RW407]PWU32082.1 hypothetical protein DK254_00755 [Pseudomonas sp. RW407]
MKRIPLVPQDEQKLSDIRKAMFTHLPGIVLGDLNPLNELLAKVFSYADYHNLRAEMKVGVLPDKSLSRSEILLAVARGLEQAVDGLKLPAAFRKAKASKLHLLRVDRLTREYRQEQELRAYRDSNPGSEKSIPDSIWTRNRNALDYRAALRTLGAPDYSLTIDKAGRVLVHEQLLELYGALVEAKDFTPPNGDMDLFIHEQILPGSWAPLRELLVEGLAVPNHRVIPLYDDAGKYIGRVIQHVVHEGVIPRLLYTDDEVVEAQVLLLTGREIHSGTSRNRELLSMFNPRFDKPVFTIRPGTQFLKSVPTHETTYQVSAGELVLLPGLNGGIIEYSTGRNHFMYWTVDGERVVSSALLGRYSEFGYGYVMTKPWLSKADLPLLYPNYIPEEKSQVRMTADPSLVLPAEVEQVQAEAERDLAKAASLAKVRVESAAYKGVLISRLEKVFDAEVVERLAGEAFDMRYRADPDGVVVAPESTQDELDARRQDEEPLYAAHVLELIDKFSALEAFGQACLRLALVNLYGNPDDIFVDELEEFEVLAQVVCISASPTPEQALSIPLNMEAAWIAVDRWLEGSVEHQALPSLAQEISDCERQLYAQAKRLKQVKLSIELEERLRKEAYMKGYAFVDGPLA